MADTGDTAEDGESLAALAGARAARPGQFVQEARELEKLAVELLTEAVIAERAKGTSWQLIGDELGVTRATAHGRFGPAVKEHERRTAGLAHLSFKQAWIRLNKRWRQARFLVTEQAIVRNLGQITGSLGRASSTDSAQLSPVESRMAQMLASLAQPDCAHYNIPPEHGADFSTWGSDGKVHVYQVKRPRRRQSTQDAQVADLAERLAALEARFEERNRD